MNNLITSTALLSITLLTSCSTIEGFRQDPDTWGEKEKIEKPQEVVTPFILQEPQQVVTPVQPINIPPAVTTNNVITAPQTTTTQGRTIVGFMEPNVTKLPDNKDLQESNNVTPALSPSPMLPKFEPLVPSLLPVAPITDPTSPLPSNP